MLKQAKMRTYERHEPIYESGVRVPRHRGEAIALDKENGNTLWRDSIASEMSQLHEYNTCSQELKQAHQRPFSF
jgi:hypothetical protein